MPQPSAALTIHEVFPIAAIEYGAGFLLLVGMRIQKQEELEYVVRCIEFLLDKLRAGGIVSNS
jgi:hypothetical protein